MNDIYRAKRLYDDKWTYGDLIHYDKDDIRILEQYQRKWDIKEAGERVKPETVSKLNLMEILLLKIEEDVKGIATIIENGKIVELLLIAKQEKLDLKYLKEFNKLLNLNYIEHIIKERYGITLKGKKYLRRKNEK